ncbi:Aste57867_17587 [Aphanomyces stellatus]|uniref:Aste57867_17587 protein n=1 Tax=Aphanomyces stellatus TaxID=120398 RepID=A0A485L9S4_9STRA|nr:hypothetical protein As57867_017527 [Aphanomyces stellatus]VFT94338.1 Aste57867_17587 [Aphanomyces stellatus]
MPQASQRASRSRPTWYVAVHIGAGKHGISTKAKEDADACMSAALAAAAAVLDAGGDATAAVESAVQVLEDADATNAGCNGSHVNLTTDGRVETDASIVDGGSGAMGCCGAVHGVRNPISLAAHLLRSQHKSVGPRQPPIFLVGEGAFQAAQAAALATIDYTVEPIAAAAVARHRAKMEDVMQPWSSSETVALDTVGAICIDGHGRSAAAVSSAGIALKQPGRVGHAGCPRLGCSATVATENYSAAFSCTGRGEHLMQAGLLQQVERHVATRSSSSSTPLQELIHFAFDDAMAANGGVPVEGGVIGLVQRQVSCVAPQPSTKKRKRPAIATPPVTRPSVDFVAAFSTPSMAVGVCSSVDNDTSPITHILRLATSDQLAVHVHQLGASSRTVHTTTDQ